MTMVVTETSVILYVFVDESFFLPLHVFLHVYVPGISNFIYEKLHREL